jgi:cytidylate kinase
MAGGGQAVTVTVLGHRLTEELRTQKVASGASIVSAYPGVRAALLDLQRELGKSGGVVLEGRDIGSVVFPDAEIKFFLTASVDIRARRRQRELRERGEEAPWEQILSEVATRDKNDTMRPISPLTQAEDAIVVDSSSMSLEEVVAEMVEKVREVERWLATRSGDG